MGDWHIKRWQGELNRRGAGLLVDGDFGKKTLAASVAAVGEDAGTGNAVWTGEIDERSRGVIGTLDPGARRWMEKLVVCGKAVGRELGYDYRLISGHRSWEEQDEIYARGRTAAGNRVTNARGGYSNHNFGIAVDGGWFVGATYLDSENPAAAAGAHRALGAAVKAAGLPLEWGGDWESFTDLPHWEVRTGLTMVNKRRRYAVRGSVL